MHVQQMSQLFTLGQYIPLAPRLKCKAHRQRLPKAYSSDSSYAPGSASGESQDLVGGMLDICISTCSRVAESAINRVADVVQSVAPPDAPRHKIEVSVKGALCLLILGLLKGVINFVLLVGSIGLAVYTATQVFGWNAVVLGQGAYAGPAKQRPQQQPQQVHHEQYQQHYTGPAAAASRGGYQAGQSHPRWQQQSEWQQQGQWNTWPVPDQADVVDVTRGTPN